MAITVNGAPSSFPSTALSADLAATITDESGTGALIFATSPTFTTPALGTPSAVTLTNGTGLPVSGISASTSDAIGVGTIELGHATDTTLARASSGVVTIEGVNVVTTSSTDTLTNKTLTSPTVNTATIAGGTLANSVIKGIEEDINVVASAATGTIDFDVDTASIWYYTTDASADLLLTLDSQVAFP
jgi:hypothetical protein